MREAVIEVGLNEAVSRREHPRVPNAPDEIAADILACAAAGASIVHFHARDPATGAQRCGDAALYREAMRAVRRAGCDVLMYPTYEPFPTGAGDPLTERFAHVLTLADDPALEMRVGPLDMGSLNFAMAREGALLPPDPRAPLDACVYQNPLPVLERMLGEYDRRQLLLSLAIFEPGHLRTTLALLDAGHGARPLLKFVLSDGWLHGLLPDPDGLGAYLRLLERLGGDRELEWMCAPSGLASPEAVEALLRAALEAGGHVRVGLGDTPAAAGGRGNPELVARAAALAAAAGRPVASPQELRRRFELAPARV